MKFAWIDLRTVPDELIESIVDAAIHAGVEAIVDDDPQTLGTLPPTVLRVLAGPRADGAELGDYVLLEPVDDERGLTEVQSRARPAGQTGGAVVDVTDDPSLTLACQAASRLPYTVVQFKDPIGDSLGWLGYDGGDLGDFQANLVAYNDDKPVSAAGRAQGIAFRSGKGRVVVLGEAAALSAQVVGLEGEKFGMNVPGLDNRQMALNIMHWLSGLLDPWDDSP